MVDEVSQRVWVVRVLRARDLRLVGAPVPLGAVKAGGGSRRVGKGARIACGALCGIGGRAERAGRARRWRSGANGAKRALRAAHTLLGARHHLERRVLVRAARARQRRRRGLLAVVPQGALLARRRLLGALVPARGALAAGPALARSKRAGCARHLRSASDGAVEAGLRDCALVHVLQVGRIRVGALRTRQRRRGAGRTVAALCASRAARGSTCILEFASIAKAALGGCRIGGNRAWATRLRWCCAAWALEAHVAAAAVERGCGDARIGGECPRLAGCRQWCAAAAGARVPMRTAFARSGALRILIEALVASGAKRAALALRKAAGAAADGRYGAGDAECAGRAAGAQ